MVYWMAVVIPDGALPALGNWVLLCQVTWGSWNTGQDPAVKKSVGEVEAALAALDMLCWRVVLDYEVQWEEAALLPSWLQSLTRNQVAAVFGLRAKGVSVARTYVINLAA